MKAIERPAISDRNTRHEPVRRARGLGVRTSVQGGRLASNHNTALSTARGLKVRSSVQGGRIAGNHNATLSTARGRSSVQGGRLAANHNQVIRRVI